MGLELRVCKPPDLGASLNQDSKWLGSMKAVLPFALILACACISACFALALIHKPSTSSLAETGAKQGGEHVAKGLMSPTPSPTPTPYPTPTAGQ
jgi:hypothetical protein